MLTIYDLVKAQEITGYWTMLPDEQGLQSSVWDVIFPINKIIGISFRYVKGAKGLPVELKTSAYDVKAVPRGRIAFEKLYAEMPLFKESKYVDEELRQRLNEVLQTSNPFYIRTILTQVFDDLTDLVKSAYVSLKKMRAQALFTGQVNLVSNGQQFSYNYGIPQENFVDASISWKTTATADPIKDINEVVQSALDRGYIIERAICSKKTFNYLKSVDAIKKALYPITNGVGEVSDMMVRGYIQRETGVTFEFENMRYKDATGETQTYIPEDVIAFFPAGTLGSMVMGTTPAESDLMNYSNKVANVSMVNNIIAVTTIPQGDPVTVETIVSMLGLPSFEGADSVYVFDIVGE